MENLHHSHVEIKINFSSFRQAGPYYYFTIISNHTFVVFFPVFKRLSEVSFFLTFQSLNASIVQIATHSQIFNRFSRLILLEN